MRRPVWRKAGSRAAACRAGAGGDTTGPALLEQLARSIDARASRVLRRHVEVAYSVARHDGYSPTPQDRLWKGKLAQREFWCLLDAASQRALLAAVLGGPGSPRMTSAERAIVGETVGRLLEVHVREENEGRPPSAGLWRCNVDLAADDRCATLQLLLAATQAPPSQPPPQAGMDLAAVPISVVVQLEPVPCTFAGIRSWRPGTLVKLPPATAGLSAQLVAGAAPLAAVTLGCAADRRAVRIAHIGSAQPAT